MIKVTTIKTKIKRPNRTKIAYGSRNHTCLIFAQVMRFGTFTPAQAWNCFPELKKDTYETRRSLQNLVRLGLITETGDEVYKITALGRNTLQDVAATKRKL